ncbi:hypothetical protein HPB51_010405 [Rhipicephalus microplus]|uniref:CCHC-type domain-containing protein n=1 Tax=Rhipicephalus microplus TaxID=6941 RepID=A0A9J6E903_RHIMP|nr:hypothetical protein HPB51_010405 [Rhipicephalus microplus]
MEDNTSSTTLEPPVLTTKESLAQTTGAPVSSHIPPPVSHQPVLSDFDVQGTPNHLHEANFAQQAPMAHVIADLASRLSVIEEQSGLQQRVPTAVERHVPRKVQPFVRLARPIDVRPPLAVRLEAEIHERSQSAEDPYRRPPYTAAPARTKIFTSTRLENTTVVLRCYRCHNVGHLARNCLQVTESLTNSGLPIVFLEELQCGPSRAGPRLMAEAPPFSLGPFTEMPALPVKLGDLSQHVEALASPGVHLGFSDGFLF